MPTTLNVTRPALIVQTLDDPEFTVMTGLRALIEELARGEYVVPTPLLARDEVKESVWAPTPMVIVA